MELCCVSIEVDFCFGLQQERLCETDLNGLKVAEFPKLALKHGILLNLPI